ncbi:MAG: hypothetical protein QM582_12580 [Micropruina sp.]|uniref:hypothetical protein n=1 Tax=Micropruina sp. TaxID=2737536 RepID=UPI0039E57FC6
MPRTSSLVVGTLAGLLTLGGCSQAGVSTDDAYKVGCPALDAVAASGSVVGKVALAGLEQLRDSGNVSGDAKKWVETSISFLSDPQKVSEADKKFVKDGCANHGYPLKNF